MPKKTKTVTETATSVKLTHEADKRIREIAAEQDVGISEVIRDMIGAILTAPGDPAAALVECRAQYEELRTVLQKTTTRMTIFEAVLLTSIGLERLSEADRKGLDLADILARSPETALADIDERALQSILATLGTVGSNVRRWLMLVVKKIHPEISDEQIPLEVDKLLVQHAKDRGKIKV